MGAPKGNRYWEQRSTHGRKALWEDPLELQDACYQYIAWVDDNPLEESVVYQGEVMDKPLPKMRPPTIKGLCVYLGMTTETWSQYRLKKDFSAVTKEIDLIIENRKYEGAAAGMLNPNIIARDLGLTDKQDLNHGGQKGNPIEVSDMSDDQLNRRIQELTNELGVSK